MSPFRRRGPESAPIHETQSSRRETSIERGDQREARLNAEYANSAIAKGDIWREAQGELLLATDTGVDLSRLDGVFDREPWSIDRPTHQTPEAVSSVDADVNALIESGITQRAQELKDKARSKDDRSNFAKALRGFEQLQDRYRSGQITSEQFTRSYAAARSAVVTSSPAAVRLTETVMERIAQMPDVDRRQFHVYGVRLSPRELSEGQIDASLSPIDSGLARFAWSSEITPWQTLAVGVARVDSLARRSMESRDEIIPSALLSDVQELVGRISPGQKRVTEDLSRAALERMQSEIPGMSADSVATAALREANLDRIRAIRKGGGSANELAKAARIVRFAEIALQDSVSDTVVAEGVELAHIPSRMSGPDVISDRPHRQLRGDSPRIAIQTLLSSERLDNQERGLAMLRDTLSEYVDTAGIAPLILGEMSLGLTVKEMDKRLGQVMDDPRTVEVIQRIPEASGLLVALHRVQKAQHRMKKHREEWDNSGSQAFAA